MKLACKANILSSCPNDWNLLVEVDKISYVKDSSSIEFEFCGDRLYSISHIEGGVYHRDPGEGPAYICFQADDEYHKYFVQGEPARSPEGYYGKVILKNPPYVLNY